ncbi:MAG: efflux RND transporter periplasmic adaptor subunit [Planctomycetes bacterium]|nr:efflux RND transporter periplasmic adaptor subunit [Planctomycetota bacterium]
MHSDFSIRELKRYRPALRPELVFTPEEQGSERFYRVEDPGRSRFYRIGLAEYAFISLFDGNTSVGEALALAARTLGEDALSEDEAAAICRWLIENGLVLTSAEGAAASTESQASAEHAAGGFNPLMLRVPLLNPDRLLTALLPWTRWAFSGPAMLVWLGVVGWAAVIVGGDWRRFTEASTGVLSPSNWLWLALAWVVLKLVHELGHALVCKKHGGHVRETGLYLILFAPVAYVDVTSSWRFRSKWARMFTAAGGMYAELFVAACAVIVWSRTESPVLAAFCYDLVLMAGLATLLFNANPLMRFDGYYVLSDLCEVPNLSTEGARAVRQWLGWLFLGVRSNQQTAATRRRRWIVGVYGVLAGLWRIIVCVGLLIAASVLLHGAGVVLAAIAAAAWLARPLKSIVRGLVGGEWFHQGSRLRFLIVSAAVFGGGTWLLWGVPWPQRAVAPGVVEHTPLAVVRADGPGFVESLAVRDGQHVAAGQVLCMLDNPELTAELADIDLAIAQSEARARIHKHLQELGAWQVEVKSGQSLLEQRTEKQRQVDRLTLRAPVGGIVMARNLHTLIGCWVDAGDEILAVGGDAGKELQVAVSQEDVEDFSRQVGRRVRLRLRTWGACEGTLVRITPRAAAAPLHPALCAPNGGPLAVRSVETTAGEDGRPQETWELTEPRFKAVIAIPAALAARVYSGQRGAAAVESPPAALAETLYRLTADWLSRQLERARSRR